MSQKNSSNGHGSKTAIFAAIIGNGLIAITKFIAAAFTGSSAMLSEGIHSVVDTGNGGLMYLGLRQSKKPPDKLHPFGHGRELYFWTIVVALSIFAVGGGVSIYEGILHLIHPVKVESPIWNYSVLGIAFVFEGFSWYFAWRAFQKTREGEGLIATIQGSKDPATFTVLFEDTAAALGLVIAAVGLLLGQVFDSPYFDGAASIVIGLVLCTVALFLGYETKSLLIGEALDEDKVDEVRRIAEAEAGVEKVNKVLTLYLGPDQVMAILEVEFADDLELEQLRSAIQNITAQVKEKYPEVTKIAFESPAADPEADPNNR